MTDAAPDDSLENVTPKTGGGPDDPDGYTADDLTMKDPYLDVMLSIYVGWVDDGRGAVGLTIQSNGAVLSGIAISRQEWIEITIESLRAAGGANAADTLEKVYGAWQSNVVEEWNRRDAADLQGASRRFIHLRDVKLYTGDRDVNLPLWRGALADVTGWSLGSWNPPGSAAASTERSTASQ